MDCYIVRIYRQEAQRPREFVGVVEEVGAEGKSAFTNIDELWEILKPDRMTDKQGHRKKEQVKRRKEGEK